MTIKICVNFRAFPCASSIGEQVGTQINNHVLHSRRPRNCASCIAANFCDSNAVVGASSALEDHCSANLRQLIEDAWLPPPGLTVDEGARLPQLLAIFDGIVVWPLKLYQ